MGRKPNQTQHGQGGSTPTDENGQYLAGDGLLGRVRDVAQKINDRVKKALGDTEPHTTLSDDATEEAPPIT